MKDLCDVEENDSVLTESIEEQLLENTGNKLSFWDQFMSTIGSGWILRPKSLTLPTNPLQAEFWVKRSKCMGEQSQREVCSSLISFICNDDLEKQKHATKLARISLKLTEKQERDALNIFSWERGLYNSMITLFSKKNPPKVCYKTIADHLLIPQAKNGKWKINYYKDVIECTIHTFLSDFKGLNKNSDGKFVLPKTINKKASSFHLRVPASMWSKKNSLLAILMNFDTFLLSHPKVPNKLLCDFLFAYDQPYNFYFELTLTRSSLEPKGTKAGNFVFIAPEPSGTITCIDSEGYISVIGGNMLKEIELLSVRLFSMRPSNDEEPGEQFLGLSKLVHAIFEIFNKKVARFLCEHFDYIFVPKINTASNTKELDCCSVPELLYMKLAVNIQYQAGTFNRPTIVKTYKLDNIKNMCSSCGRRDKAIEEFGLFCCRYCGLRSDLRENQAKTVMLMYMKPYVKKMASDSLK